jgi:hypothetical protein
MLSPTLRWPTAGHRSFSAFTRLDSAPPCWLHGIAALLSPAFARLLDLPKCSHNTRAKAGRDQHEKKGLVRKRAHKCWNAVTVSVSVGNSCLHPSSEANSTSRQNRKHNDDNGDWLTGFKRANADFCQGVRHGKAPPRERRMREADVGSQCVDAIKLNFTKRSRPGSPAATTIASWPQSRASEPSAPPKCGRAVVPGPTIPADMST